MQSLKALVPGAVRAFMTVGGWAHLMSWAKLEYGRKLRLELDYPDSEPSWTLVVLSTDHELYRGTGPNREELCLEAVNAIGKLRSGSVR